MKKRTAIITAIIMAAIMAFGLLAGCGSGSESGSGSDSGSPGGSSSVSTTGGTSGPADVTVTTTPQDGGPAAAGQGSAPADPATAASTQGGQAQGQDAAASSDPAKLVMGLDDTFAPMGYRDENNEIVGFDVDLAKEVAARLGRELVLQPIDWDSKEIELASGNIDCIWNGFTITEERKADMEMTAPYIANNQMILVLKDGGVAAKADLAGKEIGVQKGSSALDAVQKDALGGQVSLISEYPQNVDAFNDLKAGRLAAVVADEIMARYYMSTDAYKDLVLLDESLAAEEYGIGFKKGNTELRDAVQAALSGMIQDGTAGEISRKWFGQDIMAK